MGIILTLLKKRDVYGEGGGGGLEAEAEEIGEQAVPDVGGKDREQDGHLH